MDSTASKPITRLASERREAYTAYLNALCNLVSERLNAFVILANDEPEEVIVRTGNPQIKAGKENDLTFTIERQRELSNEGECCLGGSYIFTKAMADAFKSPGNTRTYLLDKAGLQLNAQDHARLVKVEYLNTPREFINAINILMENSGLPKISETELPLNPNTTAIAGGDIVEFALRRLDAMKRVESIICDHFIAHALNDRSEYIPENIHELREGFRLDSEPDNKFSIHLNTSDVHPFDDDELEKHRTMPELISYLNENLNVNFQIDPERLPEIPIRTKSARAL